MRWCFWLRIIFALAVLTGTGILLAPGFAAGEIRGAWMEVILDDTGEIYVNGNMVADLKDKRSYASMPPTRIELSADVFRNGDNVVLISLVNNVGGDLGFRYRLVVPVDDGRTIEVLSNPDETRSWFHGSSRMKEANMDYPSEGWRGIDYNERKKEKNGKWRKCRPSSKKKKLGDTGSLSKAKWVLPNLAESEKDLAYSFRHHFVLSDIVTVTPTPEPTDTPRPTATPRPMIATPEPTATQFAVVPSVMVIYTPTSSVVRTPRFSPSATHTPSNTCTRTVTPTSTVMPTSTAVPTLVATPQPIELTAKARGLIISRYFRFRVESSVYGAQIRDTVGAFRRIEFLPAAATEKKFPVMVSYAGGTTTTARFDDIRRLDWEGGKESADILIPLDDNTDNLEILLYYGREVTPANSTYGNFVLIPMDAVIFLEVDTDAQAAYVQNNVVEIRVKLKGWHGTGRGDDRPATAAEEESREKIIVKPSLLH